MHELALADAVLAAAIDVAGKEGMTRVLRVDVRVGELQRIRAELFEEALREMRRRRGGRLGEAAIEVAVEPARFRCRPCAAEFGLRDVPAPQGEREAEAIHFVPELAHAYLRCPACHSPDFEVLAGRGVAIAAIEGET